MIVMPSDPRSKGGGWGFGLAGAASGANDTKQAIRSMSDRVSGQADFDTTGTGDCCAVWANVDPARTTGAAIQVKTANRLAVRQMTMRWR